MGLRQGRTRTRLWLAEELKAELLRGDFVDFSYELHTHESACLALITGGAIRIRMRGRAFIARRGDLYAIDADEPHAGWPVDEGGWTQRTVYVDLAHLHDLRFDGEGGALRGSIRGPIIRDRGLARLLESVHRGSEAKGPRLALEQGYLQFAERLFARHVDGQRRDGPKVGREDAAIGRVRDYLDAHLDERVSLGAIAEAAGLPPYRLYRAFERDTGMTPHHYQRQARVRLAARLIRAGTPLAEVAAAAGFADQAHLTRSFHSRLAVTPGAYRSAWRPAA